MSRNNTLLGKRIYIYFLFQPLSVYNQIKLQQNTFFAKVSTSVIKTDIMRDIGNKSERFF